MSPWDSVYKLEALGKKAGRVRDPNKLVWFVHAISDMMEFHGITAGEFSLAQLSGKGLKHSNGKGILDLLLMRMDLKHHLLTVWIECPGFPEDEKKQARMIFDSHAKFREQYAELSWIGRLSKDVGRPFFKLMEEPHDD